MKRILFAGTSSSSGKTTISCGFMKALTMRGQKVASFKCGPDYIDPMFHERIAGTRAGNLDGFFLKNEQLREMLLKNSAGCDIAVLEGAMGCYDGIGFTREASGYEIAAATGTPMVLIANARGMAASLVALVRGFVEEDREGLIRGVIFNQLPAKLFPEAKRCVEAIKPGLTCFGYVPVNRALELKSRHLGLVTPDEVRDMEEKVALWAKQIEETVDVNGLIRLAGEAEDAAGLFRMAGETEKVDVPNRIAGETAEDKRYFPGETPTTVEFPGNSEETPVTGEFPENTMVITGGDKNGKILKKTADIRVAVAKDSAFSFLYRDNLNWLREHGAMPVFFSPLEDEKIPEGCQGLILPGGYPELYLERLEKNGSMRASVRDAIAAGMPTIAECGGFLYLLDRVAENTQEEVCQPFPKSCHNLVGVIHRTARNSHSLGRFGYIYLTAQTDGLLAKAGETIRAHEFHHYRTDDDGHGFRAEKASGAGSWETGYHTETLYAGFPHIYFPGNEKAGEKFLDACAGYR